MAPRRHRRGEPVIDGKPDGRKCTVSGFHVGVSDAGFDNLQRQVADAVLFLETRRAELRLLVGFPGVDSVILDFGIARRDVAVQRDSLPPDLLRLTGDLGLGIVLSRYPVSELAES